MKECRDGERESLCTCGGRDDSAGPHGGGSLTDEAVGSVVTAYCSSKTSGSAPVGVFSLEAC